MSDYVISEIHPGDRRGMEQAEALLTAEGIRHDPNLDYICGMYDSDYHLIATGSCFGNTLRCFAVEKCHQGEGLLNQIISHLIDVQYRRGILHLFLYTKAESSRFFQDLGFHEIARVTDKLVFMENRRDGFSRYLEGLKKYRTEAEGEADATSGAEFGAESGALVMNANPFTLGHQYLVEKAASECRRLHLFIVSEDASLVPFQVRRRLVMEGVSHLPNVVCHNSGPYIISNATFPSYFLKDEETVIESHARLDLAVFRQNGEALGISRRYVGEEPTSQVTGIYNQVMAAELPRAGIDCIIIPRKEAAGRPISASTVRQLIQQGKLEQLDELVPESTARYFRSPEAEDVIRRICGAGDVVHY